MNILQQDGLTVISQTEGPVWDEAFTLDECATLANVLTLALQGKFYGITPPLVPAVERLRDMFYALQNDSDACVVHA